jgi:hypothetical protein
MKLPFYLLRRKKQVLETWIKISTDTPHCIYYFGPFDNKKEAKIYQDGYIEDLVREKAQGITVEYTKGQPKLLTINRE